jgi:hypothetical protein
MGCFTIVKQGSVDISAILGSNKMSKYSPEASITNDRCKGSDCSCVTQLV